MEQKEDKKLERAKNEHSDHPGKDMEAEKKNEGRKTEKEDGETKKILEMSEISIWLDTYDDIFSDFDPRPYSLRSLSDDFLNEAKKASRDKSTDKLELRILIADNLRDSKIEATIKKRLRDHFTKHASLLRKELKETKTKSIGLAFAGILMMLAATYIYAYLPDTFMFKLFFVILEPAGWFITWFALDKFFYTNELKKTEYSFYEKMSKCEIIFSSY